MIKMRKEIWVDCRESDLEKMAKKYRVKGIVGDSKLGLRTLPGNSPVYTIRSKEDIEKLPKNSEYLIVEFTGWKILPAENILSQYKDTKIIVKINSIDDVGRLGKALEKGVNGFLVDQEEAVKYIHNFYKPNPRFKLVDATITGIKNIEMGKRVCVDGIMTYKPREGLLTGFLTEMMFLADGETTQNPYVNTREWRVNAGAASLYTLCRRDREITPRVLDDLVSGDEVVAVDSEGNTRVETVGRIKKEWRPMLYIQAEHKGKKGAACPQYAETVRIVTPDGSAPVTELKKGDRIKAYVTKPIATHFGRPVEEKIIEI